MELAAITDYGEPFIKATYKLEGDGPLALECYEIMEFVSRSVELAHAPNVEAVVKGQLKWKFHFLFYYLNVLI